MPAYKMVEPRRALGVIYFVWFLLEDLRKQEPEALATLIESRVPLRPDTTLLDHPTVIIVDDGTGAALGVLGILNGVVGSIGDPKYRIAAEFDDHDKLTAFFIAEVPISDEDRTRAFAYGQVTP